MGHKYRLSARAASDIAHIWDEIFTKSQSSSRAEKVAKKLFAAFELLAESPQAGHWREDLAEKPLKFWSVYSYLIVYNPESSPIEFIAVVHGAQDVRALLESLEGPDDLPD